MEEEASTNCAHHRGVEKCRKPKRPDPNDVLTIKAITGGCFRLRGFLRNISHLCGWEMGNREKSNLRCGYGTALCTEAM